jgi:hypothetical protein
MSLPDTAPAAEGRSMRSALVTGIARVGQWSTR